MRCPSLSSVAKYAYAAVVAGGSKPVRTAGACPLDEAGAKVGVGNVRVQAARAVGDLRVTLADAGAGLADVVRTTISAIGP